MPLTLYENLAGRVGIVNLLGLSDAEIYHEPSEPFQTEAGYLMDRLSVKRKRDLNEIYRRIFKGSMPELYADEKVDPETYYRFLPFCHYSAIPMCNQAAE